MSELDWQWNDNIPDNAPDGLYLSMDRLWITLCVKGYEFSRRSSGPTKNDMKALAKELDLPAFMLRRDVRRIHPFRWEQVA